MANPHPEKIRAQAEQLMYSADLYNRPEYFDPRKRDKCRRWAKKLFAKADRQEAKLK